MHHYEIRLWVSNEGDARQATVLTFEDGEMVRQSTMACDPFVDWRETLEDLVRALPSQGALW